MAKLEGRNDRLYIDDKEVLKGWESYSGWYWFGIERAHIQDSVIDGKTHEDDQIWFGFVQGFEEEWGYFSQAEIISLGPSRVWEIPPKALPHSGRR